jgi:hypothetical protein
MGQVNSIDLDEFSAQDAMIGSLGVLAMNPTVAPSAETHPVIEGKPGPPPAVHFPHTLLGTNPTHVGN